MGLCIRPNRGTANLSPGDQNWPIKDSNLAHSMALGNVNEGLNMWTFTVFSHVL